MGAFRVTAADQSGGASLGLGRRNKRRDGRGGGDLSDAGHVPSAAERRADPTVGLRYGTERGGNERMIGVFDGLRPNLAGASLNAQLLHARPPMERTEAIAGAFGLSAGELLPDASSQALIQTVRAARRPTVPGLAAGVSAEMLVLDLHRRIQPVVMSLAPGARHENPTGHAGEEFVLVLRGSVVLEVDDQRTELAAGDSAYYPSALSHAYENPGPEEAALFTVSAPPRPI